MASSASGRPGFSRSGVNVAAIAQGSSECSISLVVIAAEADAAVRAVHTLVEVE